jgi:DNA repair photolyase
LNKRNFRYLITTKSSRIANEEYMNALNKDLAHIQISVTCFDDARAYEIEKTCSPIARMNALYTLEKAGIDVSLRLSPFIEELIDFKQLNSFSVKKTLLEFLRINSFIEKRLPGIDFGKYTYNYGGYRHLPFSEKLRLLKQINLPNLSIAEYVPAHHRFWVRNQNPNKMDCCNLRCEKSPT